MSTLGPVDHLGYRKVGSGAQPSVGSGPVQASPLGHQPETSSGGHPDSLVQILVQADQDPAVGGLSPGQITGPIPSSLQLEADYCPEGTLKGGQSNLTIALSEVGISYLDQGPRAMDRQVEATPGAEQGEIEVAPVGTGRYRVGVLVGRGYRDQAQSRSHLEAYNATGGRPEAGSRSSVIQVCEATHYLGRRPATFRFGKLPCQGSPSVAVGHHPIGHPGQQLLHLHHHDIARLSALYPYGPAYHMRAVPGLIVRAGPAGQSHGVLQHVDRVHPVAGEEGHWVSSLIGQQALMADRVDRHDLAWTDGGDRFRRWPQDPTPGDCLRVKGNIEPRPWPPSRLQHLGHDSRCRPPWPTRRSRRVEATTRPWWTTRRCWLAWPMASSRSLPWMATTSAGEPGSRVTGGRPIAERASSEQATHACSGRAWPAITRSEAVSQGSSRPTLQNGSRALSEPAATRTPASHSA